MNLYRVTYTFDTLVAATSPQAARQGALEALPDEFPLHAGRVFISRVERFSADRASLPAGWYWSDNPIGSAMPLTSWAPDAQKLIPETDR